MANPPITDKFHDYVTPNLDLLKLVKTLDKRIAFAENFLESKAKNEFEGELIYKVSGNKTTSGFAGGSAIPPSNYDITHAAADPFRDEDVDKARIDSRGLIDRDMIEKRNILYLENKELASHFLFLTDEQEDIANLATFLIRIAHKEEQQPPLYRGAKIKFSFRDPSSMRDPHVIISKENDQSKTAGTPA